MFVDPPAVRSARYDRAARTFTCVAALHDSRNSRTSVLNAITRKRSVGVSEASSARPAALACSSLAPAIEPETSSTNVMSRGVTVRLAAGGEMVIIANPSSPLSACVSTCTDAPCEARTGTSTVTTPRARSTRDTRRLPCVSSTRSCVGEKARPNSPAAAYRNSSVLRAPSSPVRIGGR